MLHLDKKTEKFFNKTIKSWTTKTKKIIECGYTTTETKLIEVKQRAGFLCIGVELNDDAEKNIWVTDSQEGLKKAFWLIDEPGEVGDVQGELSPRMEYMLQAINALKDKRFMDYNEVIINLAIRGANNDYMFANQKLAPTINTKSINYFRHRLGEDDRFKNLSSSLRRAHFDALYPKIEGKIGFIPASSWAFTDQDTRKLEQDKRDYDGQENNHEDKTRLSLAERAKRQVENTNIATCFVKKCHGEQIRAEKPTNEIEILSAWHMPLLSLEGKVIKSNSTYSNELFAGGKEEMLVDKGFLFEEDGVIKIRPAALMGGEAMYYPRKVWDAMKAFRSDAEEEHQKQEFFLHENGEEKFTK